MEGGGAGSVRWGPMEGGGGKWGLMEGSVASSVRWGEMGFLWKGVGWLGLVQRWSYQSCWIFFLSS